MLRSKPGLDLVERDRTSFLEVAVRLSQRLDEASLLELFDERAVAFRILDHESRATFDDQPLGSLRRSQTLEGYGGVSKEFIQRPGFRRLEHGSIIATPP